MRNAINYYLSKNIKIEFLFMYNKLFDYFNTTQMISNGLDILDIRTNLNINE